MRYILLFLFLLYSSLLHAQKKIDRAYFINLLQKKKYKQVFDEAMQKRNEVYGKCAIVDYFIAKSLCLDGHREKSVEWLKYIKDNYPLKPNARQFITTEMQSCSATSAGGGALTVASTFTVPLPQAGVGGMMKGGMSHDCTDRKGLINFENLVVEEDLESRLFTKSQATVGSQNVKKLLGNGYDVVSNGKYIIASPASMNINHSGVKEVTDRLDKAYNFFTSYYGLRTPDKLITVYLSPDNATLAATAKLVHGVDVPSELLGYSLLADLSLSGISDPANVGTLYHELFHLLVRTDIGDIPAWLDEGMASLYSIARWNNDILLGSEDTWRIQQVYPEYAMSTGAHIPPLEVVLSYNWEQFNGGEANNICKASVNYAVSNYFMLYLQQRKLLQPLLKIYKERKGPGGRDQSPPASDNISIVEKLLNDKILNIQYKFNEWFKARYQFNLYMMPPPGTPSN